MLYGIVLSTIAVAFVCAVICWAAIRSGALQDRREQRADPYDGIAFGDVVHTDPLARKGR